jgi:hypothetical protein
MGEKSNSSVDTRFIAGLALTARAGAQTDEQLEVLKRC